MSVRLFLGVLCAVLTDSEKHPGYSCSRDASSADGWSTELSSYPRLYHFTNFLSHSEVEHLLQLAQELGVLSTPSKSNRSGDDGYYQMSVPAMRYATDSILTDIEQRISNVAHVPVEIDSGATITVAVLNETRRGMTNLHHDHNAAAMALRGLAARGIFKPVTELQATLLAYLSDVQAGGETVFPCICDHTSETCAKQQKACKYLYEKGILNFNQESHGRFGSGPLEAKEEKRVAKQLKILRRAAESLCSGPGVGLRVTPRSGSAILFYSNTVRGVADPRGWHGSCRVVTGRKVALQRFLYAPQTDLETGDAATARFQI